MGGWKSNGEQKVLILVFIWDLLTTGKSEDNTKTFPSEGSHTSLLTGTHKHSYCVKVHLFNKRRSREQWRRCSGHLLK